MNKNFAVTATLLIVLGIVLGAFGAHGLKEVVSAEKVASYEVGVRYQIYHGLALLILAFSANKFEKGLRTFLIFILAGVILFSGSIYLLAINDLIALDLRFLGPVTPIGGVLLIMGWGILLRKFLKMNL